MVVPKLRRVFRRTCRRVEACPVPSSFGEIAIQTGKFSWVTVVAAMQRLMSMALETKFSHASQAKLRNGQCEGSHPVTNDRNKNHLTWLCPTSGLPRPLVFNRPCLKINSTNHLNWRNMLHTQTQRLFWLNDVKPRHPAATHSVVPRLCLRHLIHPSQCSCCPSKEQRGDRGANATNDARPLRANKELMILMRTEPHREINTDQLTNWPSHDLKSRVWDPKGAEVVSATLQKSNGVRLPAKGHEQEPGGFRYCIKHTSREWFKHVLLPYLR